MVSTASLADDVFVGNKPFKGQTYGVGTEVRFALADLAQALNYEAIQKPDGWYLGPMKVEVSENQGVMWIDLEDLPAELVRVVRNKDFGSIDLYRVETKGAAQTTWGGDSTLIVFGANWCPTTAAMRSTVAEIESSKMVHVVYVDVENMQSPAYQEYDYLFEGNKVPYFVILDDKGKKLHSFTGFHTYTEMRSTLDRYARP